MAGKITLDLNNENDILVSSGVLTKLPVVNVSNRTITKWVKDGLPYETQGKRRVFPISKAIKWMIEHGKIDVKMDDFDEEDRKLLPPDLRDRLASAELKEFKLKKEKGMVIDKNEVERQAYEIGKKMKDGLYTIPIRVTDDITLRNKMEKEIGIVLENLMRDIEENV